MHMRSCVRNLETPLEWAEKLRYKVICKVWSSANKGNWHWNLKSYGLIGGWKLPWLSVITRQEERQRRHEKTEVKRRTSNEERRKKKRQGAPSTVDNFRQHLLHLNTSSIAFSMNELRKQTKMTISVREDHKILKHLILLVIDLWYFWDFSYSSAG